MVYLTVRNCQEISSHASRGFPSDRRLSECVRRAVVRFARSRCTGFNDHHGKLVEQEGFRLSRETFRRIPRAASIGSPANTACVRLGRQRSCNSTDLLTTGSKAAAPASPLSVCRTTLSAKSSPRRTVLSLGNCRRRFSPAPHCLVPFRCPCGFLRRSRHHLHRCTRPQAEAHIERLWGVLQERLTSGFRLANTSRSALGQSSPAPLRRRLQPPRLALLPRCPATTPQPYRGVKFLRGR